ncbi:MAG: serine/threonine protein kinase [Pseudonocardiaceae bacterium]
MTGWSIPGLMQVRQVRVDSVGRRATARRRNRRFVSVTYLSQEFLSDAEFRGRFMAECGRLAQVRDVRVARLRQYVECDEGAAVVADHVAGIPLRAVLRDEGAIATEAAVVVFKDALGGLAAGHAAGLAHGDLKPENVILTRAGRVRLVDFGLFTRAGRLLLGQSTPFYLAPELWNGGPPTQQGDLYAATVTFFECLAGAPPFHADSAAALATLHLLGTPPLDAVPGPVRQLMQRGLAKDPASRPGALHFLAQVEEAATDALGPGWERRGRHELIKLVTGRSRPSSPLAMAGRRSGAGRERRPVRLAVVLGGALLVAAGLSSPKLPHVLFEGPGSTTNTDTGPPVLAVPGPPGGASVDPAKPRVDHASEPRSAALAESAAPRAGTQQPVAAATSAPADRPGSVPAERVYSQPTVSAVSSIPVLGEQPRSLPPSTTRSPRPSTMSSPRPTRSPRPSTTPSPRPTPSCEPRTRAGSPDEDRSPGRGQHCDRDDRHGSRPVGPAHH